MAVCDFGAASVQNFDLLRQGCLGVLLQCFMLPTLRLGFHDPVPVPQEPQYAIESGTMRLVRRLWDAVTHPEYCTLLPLQTTDGGK